jgi:hypothetical protein
VNGSSHELLSAACGFLAAAWSDAAICWTLQEDALRLMEKNPLQMRLVRTVLGESGGSSAGRSDDKRS